MVDPDRPTYLLRWWLAHRICATLRDGLFSFSDIFRTIYEKLAEAVTDEARDLYQQRCSEISPNIRYCEYNIGDESAAEDLVQMRRQIGREDPLTSRLDVRSRLLLDHRSFVAANSSVPADKKLLTHSSHYSYGCWFLQWILDMRPTFPEIPKI